MLATPAAAQETTTTEEDASLVVNGVRIPGRIAKPAGAAKASVLLLPGSGFSSAAPIRKPTISSIRPTRLKACW